MKNNELYVKLADLQDAFRDVDGAQEIISGLKTSSAEQILQSNDSKEILLKTKEIIEYLNSVLGTKYKPTVEKNKSLIRARLREGFTVDDFKTVIDKKAQAWLWNRDMQQYLRPETLFGTKFESYLNAPETYKFSGNKQESSFERIQRLVKEGVVSSD